MDNENTKVDDLLKEIVVIYDKFCISYDSALEKTDKYTTEMEQEVVGLLEKALYNIKSARQVLKRVL